ncbi:hypothetical protein FNV43_RR01626 [Rhamnella rubrinervis]|uniref:Uncharacterized protein n=1 Tax=Rhamnella rubrinervis TaxID=2594499 RepID=A0A8K0HQT5_9ROSA|nr:hypothetical protein FNV43_RR01626 [Rhamnella rubrinervis]
MVGRPEFQKFRDGGIFPKGVAGFGILAMMVGNVRPSMAREATAIWCGFWSGSQCARGSEGMLVAVVLRCLFCWGLSSILRGTLWLVFGPATCIAFKTASQSNPRHAKPWLPLSGMRLQSLALGGIADASLCGPCLAVPAWLQLIRSHAWSASLSHGLWAVGWRWVWLYAMVYELWYGCVCLRARFASNRFAALSRFATGPCVSSRLGSCAAYLM